MATCFRCGKEISTDQARVEISEAWTGDESSVEYHDFHAVCALPSLVRTVQARQAELNLISDREERRAVWDEIKPWLEQIEKVLPPAAKPLD
jgi:hypothetical protein